MFEGPWPFQKTLTVSNTIVPFSPGNAAYAGAGAAITPADTITAAVARLFNRVQRIQIPPGVSGLAGGAHLAATLSERSTERNPPYPGVSLGIRPGLLYSPSTPVGPRPLA